MSSTTPTVRDSKPVPAPSFELQNRSRSQPRPFEKTKASEIIDLEGSQSEEPPLQAWNRPRGNIARFTASFFSMFVFGLSDAAGGALLPYVCQR